MTKHQQVEQAVRALLVAIGEDPDREGLVDTPSRVARMYLDELCIGTGADLSSQLSTTFQESHTEMIVVRDIPLFSLCEHHIIPYIGTCHVGYIPDGKLVGLSKIARLVQLASRRLTIQERLTSEIADAIGEALSPLGVMVVITAEHLCMTMRGVQKPGARTTTSAVRGVFLDDPDAKTEFLKFIDVF